MKMYKNSWNKKTFLAGGGLKIVVRQNERTQSAKSSLFQSSDMTWKLSILPHSESCPAASWSPWRLVLPLLSLSLHVRWVTAGGGGGWAEETADLEMKIWLELVVGGAGVNEEELEGRWMGGLLFLLRMPMRVGFFWVCSACCWLCTCWWRISWTSSWGKINKQAVKAKGIQILFE